MSVELRNSWRCQRLEAPEESKSAGRSHRARVSHKRSQARAHTHTYTQRHTFPELWPSSSVVSTSRQSCACGQDRVTAGCSLGVWISMPPSRKANLTPVSTNHKRLVRFLPLSYLSRILLPLLARALSSIAPPTLSTADFLTWRTHIGIVGRRCHVRRAEREACALPQRLQKGLGMAHGQVLPHCCRCIACDWVLLPLG